MNGLRALPLLAGVLLALGLAGAAAAQDAGDGTTTQAVPAADENGAITLGGEARPDETIVGETREDGGLAVVAIDYAGWEAVAERAEGVVARGQGSDFVLRRLRADLVEWRDLFLAGQSVNVRRIQTMTGQVTALGVAPKEGEPPEDPSVTARRGTLETQLAALRAPGRLAEEAHARADGLIREIDVLLRAKNRAQLMERGPSPLSPAIWRDVAAEVTARASGLWKELRVSLTSQARLEVLAENWPWVAFYLVLAWGLFRRGARVIDGFVQVLVRELPRGVPIWRFLGSLGRSVLPVLGVTAFVAALAASGMFGFRATRLLDALPMSALFYFAARWLAVRSASPPVTAAILISLGLTILATRGTAGWLQSQGIPCETVNKVFEGGRTIVDRLKDGDVALVMNTTEGAQAVADSRDIRAVALYDKIPYFTTAAASHAAALAMKAREEGEIGVRSLQV